MIATKILFCSIRSLIIEYRWEQREGERERDMFVAAIKARLSKKGVSVERAGVALLKHYTWNTNLVEKGRNSDQRGVYKYSACIEQLFRMRYCVVFRCVTGIMNSSLMTCYFLLLLLFFSLFPLYFPLYCLQSINR